MSAQCPLCCKPSKPHFKAVDRNRRVTDEVFTYYRCGACGPIFLRPIPANLGDYYPNEYHLIPASQDELRQRAAEQRHKLDLIQSFVPGGTLLELGPSYGSFAFLAQQSGFDVEAIEMSPQCCVFLERVAGIRTVQSDAPACALADMGPYDVIAMYHVLEHVPDPWALLKVSAERLQPGGILVIAVPNPESLQFRMFGSRWFHLDAPRHLQLIPAATLSRFLESVGLERLLVTATNRDAEECNFAGWVNSWVNLATGANARRVLLGLMRRTAPWIRRWERRGQRGSAYTVVFRKPLA